MFKVKNLWGRKGPPPLGWGRGDAYEHVSSHMSYHANFGHSEPMRTSVIMEIRQNIDRSCPAFQLTEGQ